MVLKTTDNSSDFLSIARSSTLSILLDNIFINYSVIDKDGNYITQNKTIMDSITGGKTKAQDIDQASWENCKQVMKEGKRAIVEEKYGKEIFLSIKQPIYKDAQCIGIVILSFDVTDRKRAEQLQKEKEIISEKLALTEEFAGFLAHEMRTPIAALNLDLDTIVGNEKNQNVEEKRNNLYQIIAKGKQTIKEANIFIDMLLLKLRSMGKKVKQEDLNPCLILEDVSDALALYPFTETERTQVILDENDAFIYLGDSLHTQHIILNLLKNALKIIREEGKGEIHITFEQGEDYNKLIFTDTAKGIAQEFLPSIFDAFITKDDTKKGTGLGLAYCKIIMHGYGGDITCESKLGKYTKFILTFPKINIADLEG